MSKKALCIIAAILCIIMCSIVYSDANTSGIGVKKSQSCKELVDKYLGGDPSMIDKLLNGEIPPHILKRQDDKYIINVNDSLFIINESALKDCKALQE